MPSHGWTNGWLGRRDRALLVLAHPGLPYRHLATLTADDVTILDGTATIAAPAGPTDIPSDDDPVVCGPCVLARWLRALHYATTHVGARTLAQAIDRAEPVTSMSPHLCRTGYPFSAGIETMVLLPPIDPRGHLAITPQPLSPHSLSQLARANTTGGGTMHLVDPRTADDPEATQADVVVPAVAPSNSHGDWEKALDQAPTGQRPFAPSEGHARGRHVEPPRR